MRLYITMTNNINFKAVPEYSKKITGEMKYALSNQVGAIKSAIIDIYRSKFLIANMTAIHHIYITLRAISDAKI